MKTRILLLLLFASSLAFAQLPTTNLTGYYEFTNGSMGDAANGNNFAQTGTALLTETDRFNSTNNAIDLNGDYLTANYFSFGSEIALSFWVKTNTNEANSRIIFQQKDNVGFNVYLKDGKIGVSGRNQYYDLGEPFEDFDFDELFSTIVTDNIWHHVVVNIKYVKTSGAKFDFYIDVYTDTIKESVTVGRNYFRMQDSGGVNFNTPFKVANNKYNNLATTRKYIDVIDDLLFYNRILTDAEVTQIAELSGFGFCFTPDIANLTVGNITENSADISWTDSGTYDIAYGLKSEPFSNYTIISNVATGNSSIAGLSSSNYYNVYYRTKCTSSYAPMSIWSLANTFRTDGRFYVKEDATGFNDGSSWLNAFTDLQDALTNVKDDDEIWVAKGTYLPNASDKTISLDITKENISMYGGFDGTEFLLTDRDLASVNTVNESILSGDLMANDDANIDFSNATRSDNSLIVLRIKEFNTLIDGFTVSGGNSTVNAAGILYARGDYTKGLTIKNSIIKNNVADEGAGLFYEAYYGGDALIIDRCVFENNVARGGAALSYIKKGRYSYSATISNTLFNGNVSKNLGSSNNGFAASAGWFRGLVYSNGSNVTVVKLINNTYVNNSDIGTSSGLNNFNRATIGVTREVGTSPLTAEISNCIFWNNTTVGGGNSKSISGLNSTMNTVNVFNSIDPDSFSVVPVANTINVNNVNPMFIDAVNNDFTLISSSPAIDTGDNSLVPAGIITDLAGNSRIINITVDMGAFEYGATLGVEDFESNNKFTIYPNPTSSILNIKMQHDIKNIEIYNVQGQQVLVSKNKSISVSHLTSGMYLLKVETAKGNFTTKRFIKQ